MVRKPRLLPVRHITAVMITALSCVILVRPPMISAQPNQNQHKHAAAPSQPLTAYFIDVEGGQSTLFVTPSHQSLLVDTGWPDNGGRDADRIIAVAKKAHLDHIDYVLLTHFHQDHAGGVASLSRRIRINAYIDHGPNREPQDEPTEAAWLQYQKVLTESHARRIVATPGESIPLAGLRVEIVSADGNLISTPLVGAGKHNPYCKNSPLVSADQTENARSVGIVVQYGMTRLVDLGDLTMDKEMQLMCPINKLGPMDVYVVSHHGWFHSGSRAFVDGIAPRVAIMDNGETKGGSPSAWDTIENSPRLNTLWQLHYSAEGGAKHNVGAPYIANLNGGPDGNYLRLLAYPDGKLIVYNSRTEQSKTYPAPR